jgi:hypothetical protein
MILICIRFEVIHHYNLKEMMGLWCAQQGDLNLSIFTVRKRDRKG